MNTRNFTELKHFQSLSDAWWDEKGPFQLLHEITPQRVTFIKEKVGIHFHLPRNSLQPFQGLRVLDVGCGGGILCEPLARLGAEVIGIDPVRENIIQAQAHAEVMRLSITYLPCALEELPKDLPLFDVILASEIIEHVENPDIFLKSASPKPSK